MVPFNSLLDLYRLIIVSKLDNVLTTNFMAFMNMLFVVVVILFIKYLFIMANTDIIMFDIQLPNLVSFMKYSGAENINFSNFDRLTGYP